MTCTMICTNWRVTVPKTQLLIEKQTLLAKKSPAIGSTIDERTQEVRVQRNVAKPEIVRPRIDTLIIGDVWITGAIHQHTEAEREI